MEKKSRYMSATMEKKSGYFCENSNFVEKNQDISAKITIFTVKKISGYFCENYHFCCEKNKIFLQNGHFAGYYFLADKKN